MTTRERIVHILQDYTGLPEQDISDSTKLVDELGLDSLDLAEIGMELEDEFDRDFNFDIGVNQTVGELVKAVKGVVEV